MDAPNYRDAENCANCARREVVEEMTGYIAIICGKYDTEKLDASYDFDNTIAFVCDDWLIDAD